MVDTITSLIGSSLKMTNDVNNIGKKVETQNQGIINNKVGVVYDVGMCMHLCREEAHPESPRRIVKIYDNMQDLLPDMTVVKSRPASRDEIVTTHSPSLFDKIKGAKTEREYDNIQSQYNSFYMNHATFNSALLAAGCVIEMAEHVVTNKVKHGVAIVRPPGHHAEHNDCMGFCVFNNVAVAANDLKNKYGLKRIAIVDWDVHHGNATQHMFYDTDEVMFISLHRYDNGGFYPGSKDAGPNKIGKAKSKGYGYNVNIGWNVVTCNSHSKAVRKINNDTISDNEYGYAFDQVVIPLLTTYKPELILVSAGFDCAYGDPLGGISVTENGFRYMTASLLKLAPTVIALEGGYNIDVISSCMRACVTTLIDHTNGTNTDIYTDLTDRINVNPQSVKDVNDTKQHLKCVWPQVFGNLD